MAFDLSAYIAALTNPVWGDAAHTFIVLQGTINGTATTFVATPNDVEEHGVAVYNACVSGTYGAIGAYVAPVAPTPTLAQLQASLVSAASAVCQQVLTAIQPNSIYQTAFTQAASIINASGGAAPTSGPMVARLNTLALAYGFKNADGTPNLTMLVNVVDTLQGASLDLSNALMALEAATAVATTSAALASALATFETAIGAVVTEVNAVLLAPVAAPAAISIVGINA